MKHLFTAAFILGSSTSFSSPSLEVWGRAYENTCSVHSNTTADFDVTFRDSSLPWGTKISLISGLGGIDASPVSNDVKQLHWQNQREQEMPAVAANTWRVRRSAYIADRSYTRRFSSLEFTIKIQQPGRDPQYVNSNEPWSYLRSTLDTSIIGCAPSVKYLPEFRQLDVAAVPAGN